MLNKDSFIKLMHTAVSVRDIRAVSASEKNFTRGFEDRFRAPSFWGLLQYLYSFLHSNQNIDKTATTLRFRNILLFIL